MYNKSLYEKKNIILDFNKLLIHIKGKLYLI